MILEKGWGYEKWITNNESYCGKLLVFEKNKKCSWHFHEIKDEVFYLYSGKLKVSYSLNDNLSMANSIILLPGDSFHVPPGMRHQMYGIEQSELFEFSTQHHESDTYRLVKGD